MKTNFGELVKYLRKRMRDYDEDQTWTQKNLAQRARMSEGTLKSIENGSHSNIGPYVKLLADALQLSEFQKHHFYAVAGLIYPLQHSKVTQNDIVNILAKLDCPAYARTALWDFIAFNDYHRQLWGYDDQMLSLLRKGDLGPNLLRVLFEDDFQNNLKVRRVEDKPKRAMKIFRGESFQYVATERYKRILSYFKNTKNTKFQDAWRQSEQEDDEDLALSLDRTFVTIDHPKYGRLNFFSAKVPERYVSGFVTVAVYHPLTSSSSGWQEFCQNIKVSQVHRFLDIPNELT
ncbi:MAG: hypothetical protein RLP44_11880 [Aggregatilineales bacterium]